jgi:hypothetical protein
VTLGQVFLGLFNRFTTKHLSTELRRLQKLFGAIEPLGIVVKLHISIVLSVKFHTPLGVRVEPLQY